MLDLKRKAELFLCQVLAGQLPGQFFPSIGGTDGYGKEIVTPEAEIIPPFTIAEVLTVDKRLPQDCVYQVTARVVYCTSIYETTPMDHVAAFQAIYNALNAVRLNNPQIGVILQDLQIAVSGMEVESTEEIYDEAAQIHGDSVILAMGISG